MEKNNLLKGIKGPAPIAEKLLILDTSDLYVARVAKEGPAPPAEPRRKIIPKPDWQHLSRGVFIVPYPALSSN